MHVPLTITIIVLGGLVIDTFKVLNNNLLISGHGNMGISNSIGSNTFDILLCLGLPWLIKSLFYPSYPDNHWVSDKNHEAWSRQSYMRELQATYRCFVHGSLL